MNGDGDGQGKSSANGGTDASEERCENCGQAIDTSEWYPVTTHRDDEGSLQILSFCSESCRSDWLAEHED